MKKTTTKRGFDVIEFKDFYKEECSLQKSSLATEDAIWLGVDDPKPQIMCSDAIKLGIRKRKETEEDNGWCDFKIPDEVLISTRMHLNRKQVAKLLPYLIGFVLKGELVKSRKCKFL